MSLFSRKFRSNYKTNCGKTKKLHTLTENIFRQINWYLVISLFSTVWKSNVKRDHPQKFSVKLHTWILPNLLLEMHGFLSLWDTFRLCWLNEICRVGFLLTFTLMKFFLLQLIGFEIFWPEGRLTLKSYNFWRNQRKSEVSMPKGRSNPPLLKSIGTSGPNLPKN